MPDEAAAAFAAVLYDKGLHRRDTAVVDLVRSSQLERLERGDPGWAYFRAVIP